MGSQSLTLPIAGLVTDPGPFSAAPPGSLATAHNLAFRRAGVAEPRAKMVYEFDLGLDASPSCQAVYRHYDGSDDSVYWFGTDVTGSTVRRDTAETITGAEFSTTVVNCESSGGRLFATSLDGIVTCDSNSDTTFRLAGMPQPAAPLVLALATSGWLATDTTTAYRVAFARNTAGGRLIVGPPSNAAFYRNTSGGSVLPGVVAYLPPSIEEGDTIQLYRAYQVTPATENPADEYRLRGALPITAAMISLGYIAIGDYLPDDEWNGPSLYTNEGQEGILLANTPPGYAVDVKQYNNMMFYAGHRTPHEVVTTVGSIGWKTGAFVSYYVAASSFNVGNTITLAAPITAYGQKALRVGQIVTVNTQPPGATSTYFSANTKIASFSGSTITLDTPVLTPLAGALHITCWDWLEVDDGTNQYLIAPNAVDDAGAATAMDTYLPTSDPLVFGVRDETGALPPDRYMGGAPDMERAFAQAYPTAPYTLTATPSGQGSYLGITIAVVGKTALAPSFVLRSSNPDAFDKPIDATTGVTSELGGATGRLAWSKIDIPDAVPLPYFADVGDPAQPILRVMPTQDALWIFKTDGVWRCYGQTPDNLSIDLVDPTSRLSDRVSQWVARYGDTVYALTSRGVCEYGNFGVRPIDQAIHQEIKAAIGNPGSGAFQYVSRPFSMASSYGRFVLFGAASMTADTDRSKTNYAFVYWPELGTWSTWEFTRAAQAAGSGFLSESLLGIENGYADYVDEEAEIRSATVAPSYDDPQLELVVDAVSGTTVTIVGDVNYAPAAGDAIFSVADSSVYYVTDAASSTEFTVDRAPTFEAGNAIRPKIAFLVEIEWIATAEGNPFLEKVWKSFTFAFDRLRGGQTVYERFYGYQNGASTAGSVFGFAPVTYDPDLDDPVYATFRPFIQRDHVPTDVATDWALRVGLLMNQAGAWFTTSGIALEYETTGPLVGGPTRG